jgi:signal transduction histidine kinase
MRPTRKPEPFDLSRHSIGDFKFDFFIFDRDPAVLNLLDADKAGLKKYLDTNGGIRVYRDGVRVFDFGEQGNDWLALGDRRVQIPTIRVGNNQIVGAITLDAETSTSLIEKTNREGFIENEAYEDFRQAVLFTLSQVEVERAKDKERLRVAYSRGAVREPVVEDLAELREELRKRQLTKELGPYVDRVEAQFEQVRDTLMTAASAGLTLTTVIHEVEKIIKELVKATKRGAPADRIGKLVEHLDQMVEGLAFLVKHSGMRAEKASVLINQALFNSEYRFRAHGIHVIHGIDQGDADFTVKCSRRLIVSTLMNLFDNSIYWLESKGGPKKEIYVGTTRDLNGKPAIVVADSGPGFKDPPEFLIRPFITRKPDGMGLGLHLANEIAKLHKGELVFPESGDLKLPAQIDGAVVAIAFREAL